MIQPPTDSDVATSSVDQSGTTPRGAGRVMSGTVQVFLAESLILPSGLITAALLSRRLGPADYSLFTVAATLVAWLQ